MVAPRPIAWVSSRSAEGLDNLSPFSYFNLLNSNPPTVVFSCIAPTDRHEKDTLANVRATRQYVINLASRELLEQVHDSSQPLPHGTDEFATFGIGKAACARVDCARVAAAPVSFECELLQCLDIDPPPGAGGMRCTAVIGRIVGLHVQQDLLDAQGRFDAVRARLVARMGGFQYAEIGTIIDMAGRSPGAASG